MLVSKITQAVIHYFKDDHRRINHALKVYGFAHGLAGLEGLTPTELEIVDLAGLLHDIGIKEAERKYQSSAGKYQELEGPPVAAGILEAASAAPELIQRVSHLIGNHHTYGKIDGLDFQILVEADFIVNAFEDEMEPAAIRKILDKYFKTSTGRKIIESLYLTGKA